MARLKDPSRTGTIRNQFQRALNKRFRKIKAAVKKWLLEEDQLGWKMVNFHPDGTTGVNEYVYPATKLQNFADFIQAEMDKIFELSTGSVWMHYFLEKAYRVGKTRGRVEATKAGYTKRDPYLFIANEDDPLFAIDQQELDLILARNYTYIKSVTSKTSSTMGKLLAEAMSKGLHPFQLAKELVKVLDVSAGEARTIARTEMMRAHNDALWRQYEEFGVGEVGVEVEWLATPDERVCEQCASMDGSTFPLESMRGVLPVHPNCRCVLLPVTKIP